MLSKKIFKTFTNSVRQTALQMVTQAQSGHPGGSFSSIDFLSVLYLEKIAHNQSPLVVSNGHISPAIYAILAELGVFTKNKVIQEFRQNESIFEGHVAIDVPGVCYSTGPLGTGVSAASGLALAYKMQKDPRPVYATLGDGEAQEGQVYEMAHFANKHKLDNFTVLVDYNQVQLTDSLQSVMPINIKAIFKAANWNVLDCDGHNPDEILAALNNSESATKPTVILCHTIMGKGVTFMESEGLNHKATWHGKAPSKEIALQALSEIQNSVEDQADLKSFIKSLKFKAQKIKLSKSLAKTKGFLTGQPRHYDTETLTDCRTAYGNALKDLALLNPQVVALTADLSGSVKTNILQKALPSRHIEAGICEQNMISVAGGVSRAGMIPFASTFGAFMTSRAKDQARVNDINHTNVKMVATHCGLSVGEDGPTHQSIDDVNSFLGHINTEILEPADPNQADRITRFIASHNGNFYMRMGRHKFPVLTDIKGEPIFSKKYKFKFGKSDQIRSGKKLTIIATGACVHEACLAIDSLAKDGQVDLFALSSLKHIDSKIIKSMKKTRRLIVISDHLVNTGVFSVVANTILDKAILLKSYDQLGVTRYHRSAKQSFLYDQAGIGSKQILKKIKKII